ncbi:MAG: hypothetical protein U0746_08505 [Gemmataceae bacterium]
MNVPHNANATPLPAGMLAAGEAGVVRLRIDYPANPPLHCVAAVVVRAESPHPAPLTPMPSSLGSLTVRLTAPGCQVVPDEAALNLAQQTPTTLYLTPLAAGQLPGAVVEVLRQGQPMQRVALSLSVPRPGGWRKWLWLALALPAAWWWLTAADASLLSDAITNRLPPGPWIATVGPTIRHALELMAGAERSLRIGLVLAAIPLAVAVLTLLARRTRRRTQFGPPLALGAATPSSRGRGVPAYLTPVSPDELAQVQL